MNASSLETGEVEIRIDDEDLPRDTKPRVVSLNKYMSSLPLQNVDIPVSGVDDMTKLNYLHEASILDNLRRFLLVKCFVLSSVVLDDFFAKCLILILARFVLRSTLISGWIFTMNA